MINHVNNYLNNYCHSYADALYEGNQAMESEMGRPPVPTHLKRDKRLVVMLTDSENELLANAAKAAGAASLSDWVRDLLLEAATQRQRAGNSNL
jgi:hypothetical protein